MDIGQRVRMNLRAFILRLREDWIYCGGGHIIVLDSLIFQSCHFCSRFFEWRFRKVKDSLVW